MPNIVQNRPVRIEFSGDASTIGTVNLYLPDSQTAYTLLSGEGFALTDLLMVTSVAARLDLINDTDGDGVVDSGERVAGGNFAPNGGIAHSYITPVFFKLGVNPKIKSDTSGVQTVTGSGFIYR